MTAAHIQLHTDELTARCPKEPFTENQHDTDFAAVATYNQDSATVTITSPAIISMQAIPARARKPRAMQYTTTITANLPVVDDAHTPALDWSTSRNHPLRRSQTVAVGGYGR